MACWATEDLTFDPAPISERDLVYLAGLFDGEGCVVVKSHRRAGITLSMNDEPTITWLQATFGGRLLRQKKQYRWELDRVADLAWLLPRLIPFTRLKRLRLEAALALVEFTKLRPGLKNAQLAAWNEKLPAMTAPLQARHYDTEQR